jgi:hypothetical protein
MVSGSVDPNTAGSYILTYSVSDPSGNSASVTCTVTVVDTTPPTLICQADIDLPCSLEALVAVDFAAAASDTCDAAPTISYSHQPSSGFPVGTTIVSVMATDASGNSTSCSFAITRAALGFEGFLPPIGDADATGGDFSNPLRTFKLKSTIPVKFRAFCEERLVTTGVPRLQVVRWTSATTSTPPIDAKSTDAATTGNAFRLTRKSWHYDLDTQATGRSAGIWQFIATRSDGSQHEAWVQIK